MADDAERPIAPEYGPPATPPGYGASKRVAGAPANWWRRAIAIILDGIILSVPNGILSAVFALEPVTTNELTDEFAFNLGDAIVLSLISLAVSVIYSGVLEGSAHGQSVGKMAMKIQVRDAENLGPVGFARAASRRFVYQLLFLLLGIPGLINGLSPLWDARRQAWHDKAQNTLVVNSA